MPKELVYAVKPRINGVNLTLSSLPDGAIRQGTLIVNGDEKAFYEGLLRIMNQQVLISFRQREENLPVQESGDAHSGRSSVRIFPFLKSRRENSRMTAAIIKHCTEWKRGIDFEIPGILTCLQHWRYCRYYFSSVPTVLLEITNVPPGEKELFSFHLERALMKYYGLNLAAERVDLFRGELNNVKEDEQANQAIQATPAEQAKQVKPIRQICQVDEDEGQALQHEQNGSLVSSIVADWSDEEDEQIIQEVREEGKANQDIKKGTTDTVAGKKAQGKIGNKDGGNKEGKNRKKAQAKRKKDSRALFLPPDGPLFQFTSTTPVENSRYPLPPHLDDEQIIPFSTGFNGDSPCSCAGREKSGQKKDVAPGVRCVPVNRDTVKIPPNLS